MTTQANQTRATLVRKITMSEVSRLKRNSGGFKPKVHFGADDNGQFAPYLIARVIGIATSSKLGSSNFGDYYEFLGNFSAINHDGEMFRSPKAILPEPAQSLLQAAVEGANGGTVELAFDFMAVPDSGDKGYKFEVIPLMQRDPADPLDTLLADVNSKFALPAPKQQSLTLETAAEKADEPAEDPKPKKSK